MKYLLGPGGLSARPSLTQCKDSTVTAEHVSMEPCFKNIFYVIKVIRIITTVQSNLFAIKKPQL